MFQSIIDTTGNMTIIQAATCTLVSLILGLVISLVFRYKNKTTKGLMISLVLLPMLVQMVIMMVNGNVGTGVAIMGAFSLVRFRSNPGNAKDICSVFFAMAVGLATGMGYVSFAIFMTVVVCITYIVLSLTNFGTENSEKRQLRITIPENLNYSEVFSDLFEKYTVESELDRVKTTNMGSMFELSYTIAMRNKEEEKEFIDALRCRNGNLSIICGKITDNQTTL